MALSVCKYMELKTGKSTNSILKLLRSVTDAMVVNKLTGEESTLRSPISNEILELLKSLEINR